MFLNNDFDTGGQHLLLPSSGCEWATTIMAPDLVQPRYKKSLALVSDSPVAGLARTHVKSAPLDSKRLRPSKLKLRKTSTSKQQHPSTITNTSSSYHDMSDADDKKRNKLGYQRISIACAHCRRRKIRCLVAENDPQNRCQNCIRLKKDCLFYPVDQQSAMESRPESKSKHGHASSQTSSVTTSSPQRPINGSIDQASHPYGTYSDMSDVSNGYPGIPISPGGSYPSSGYPIQQPQAPLTPWSLADEYPPPGQAISAASNPNYTPYGGMPMNPDYHQFPGSLDPEPGSMQRAASMAFPQDGDRPGWQPQHQPVRSLSYPDYPGEGLYGSQYMSGAQQSGLYQSQAPLQMPMHSASMSSYPQPTYMLSPDHVNATLPGAPMHQSYSEQGQWLQSGPPRQDERSRPLMSPQ